ELTIPFRDGVPSSADLRKSFEQRYAALFGRPIQDASVEVLSWQMRVSRETWRPHEQEPDIAPAVASESHCARDVFEAMTGRFERYSVYERGALGPGSHVRGPALVVEDETTTVVTAAFNLRRDAFGHLVLERGAALGATQ